VVVISAVEVSAETRARVGLGAVTIIGGLVAVFLLLWLIDLISPATEHRAVVSTADIEISERRRVGRIRAPNVRYTNHAISLDGTLLDYGQGFILGAEFRDMGVGSAIVVSVSSTSGRVVRVENDDATIDLRLHPYMLITVGIASAVLIGAVFGGRALARRAGPPHRTSLVLGAAGVGLAAGALFFGLRERAVVSRTELVRDQTADVVAFGDIGEVAALGAQVLQTEQVNPPSTSALSDFRFLAVEFEVARLANSTVEEPPPFGRSIVVDRDGRLGMEVDLDHCGRGIEDQLSWSLDGGRRTGWECYALPGDDYEPHAVVLPTDTALALPPAEPR
jgi:hypothetical protein